jgi:hypothetical protein
MPLPIRSAIVFALVVTSSVAAAGSRHKIHRRQARLSHALVLRECVKAPVEVVAGNDSAKLSLARCDGAAHAAGVDRLSTLAHASRAHRLDAMLVERLELTVDHFRKGTEASRIVLVSGYRPRGSGSFHSTGKALDFRIEGVPNDALAAFCKTLPDTGCGYYPHAGFVHMDARDPGTGHVAWTDVSRSGEAPRYVASDSFTTGATLPALPGHDEGAKAAGEKTADKDERPHSL